MRASEALEENAMASEGSGRRYSVSLMPNCSLGTQTRQQGQGR